MERPLLIPNFVVGFISLIALIVAFASDSGTAQTRIHQSGAPNPSGDAIYSMAKPRLLQIRTLPRGSDSQSSIGSGFFVSPEGLIMTNYHVISQAALEPSNYRLEYVTTDNQRGELELMSFDVVNDLAIVRLTNRRDQASTPYFEFSSRAQGEPSDSPLSSEMSKGERLFAMGNPLDLGMTIVEGNYNSLVAKSYTPRIHYAGALNPGMSGGPTVDARGQVVGVNVAKRGDGEQVSFLVPVSFAKALLERVKANPTPIKDSRELIREQLIKHQEQFVQDLRKSQNKQSSFGSFLVKESSADWLSCWGRSNSERTPNPKFKTVSHQCDSNADIFLAKIWRTGRYRYTHRYIENEKLNSFQFTYTLTDTGRLQGTYNSKYWTPGNCQQNFIQQLPAGYQQRLTICSRAYRDLEGLYEFSAGLISRNGDRDALVSEITLQGVSWKNGMGLIADFVKSVDVQAKAEKRVSGS